MPRVCPERPELLDGVPIGMYHCPACGCMVVAAMPHAPHDADGCYLDEIPDGEFVTMVVEYGEAYAALLDVAQRPRSSGLPASCAWVWVTGPVEPHWAIRGTGLVSEDSADEHQRDDEDEARPEQVCGGEANLTAQDGHDGRDAEGDRAAGQG